MGKIIDNADHTSVDIHTQRFVQINPNVFVILSNELNVGLIRVL